MARLVKQWLKVTHVHPESKQIQGLLRDGGTISVSVFEIPPSFRWPVEGEIWSVERDALGNAQWTLGCRIHDVIKDGESPITDMASGDLRLDSNQIVNASGSSLLIAEEYQAGTFLHAWIDNSANNDPLHFVRIGPLITVFGHLQTPALVTGSILSLPPRFVDNNAGITAPALNNSNVIVGSVYASAGALSFTPAPSTVVGNPLAIQFIYSYLAGS